MPLPDNWSGRLKLPAVAAPMFLASGPELVIETCRSGLVGTFPALNQRTTDGFVEWLEQLNDALTEDDAPYGVNLIVHRSNPRLEADLEQVVKYKVPLVITSLGAVPDVVEAVHSYGGLVFHDVINRRHAEKAVEAGVDGIIAICAGAGGHAGTLSPFALIPEIREIFNGTILLGGAMSSGAHVAAARALGADLAYLGTRFIATQESLVPEAQKQMILDSAAGDVVYTPAISGVNANFMRASIIAAGLDPDDLPPPGKLDMDNEAKAWKTVWSAGQGVGSIRDVPSAADLCRHLREEYRQTIQHLTQQGG